MRQVRQDQIDSAEADDEIAIAGDVQPRHNDLLARERSEQFPTAIDSTIPIQPTTESSAHEFLYVEIDVRFREPGRKRLRIHHAIQKAAVSRHHSNFIAGLRDIRK